SRFLFQNRFPVRRFQYPDSDDSHQRLSFEWERVNVADAEYLNFVDSGHVRPHVNSHPVVAHGTTPADSVPALQDYKTSRSRLRVAGYLLQKATLLRWPEYARPQKRPVESLILPV